MAIWIALAFVSGFALAFYVLLLVMNYELPAPRDPRIADCSRASRQRHP